MTTTIVIIVILTFILVLNFRSGRWPFRGYRRKKLMEKPFPDDWEKILREKVALYRYLPDLLKKQLHSFMQVFLAEKNLEGCGGLKLTDEIKVTVAAQACILLLNRKPNYYPKLDSILIYPTTYIVKETFRVGPFLVEGEDSRLGESWSRGSVVLAWDDVKRTAHDCKDGQNLVLHEFAHQLDVEDGIADGLPILEQRSSYVTWARILSKEYKKLQKKAILGRKDILDHYGATDPAEFFAVATEVFFEKPRKMKAKRPELYSELSDYFKLDPTNW